MSGHKEIGIARRNRAVVVTLDRPQALNALTLEMCRAIDQLLTEAAHDPAVGLVLIKGAGERAFCAGGDIRFIHGLLEAGRADEATAFYAVEYPMNARLHAFPKPWLAILDGITMGGGVGISIHGSHRIVTERTVFAMPETGIGLFPDVGSSYVLPRLPGASGMFLGLTGTRLGPGDCLELGIGTHVVPSSALDALEHALAEASPDDLEAVLALHGDDPPPSELAPFRDQIDRCFGQDTIQGVVDALANEGSPWAQAQIDELKRKSPTSLAITHRQLTTGGGLDFAAAMRMEYRLAHRVMRGHDFREGVRALIVDKDQAPAWRPAHLDAVRAEDIDAYFAPLPEGDLDLGSLGGGP